MSHQTILRAIAGNSLFNSLHTACFMYGLPIYEIKSICHHVRFFIISQGSFQHFTNFLKKKQNKQNKQRQTNKNEQTHVLSIKYKQLLSPSSFFISILIIAHVPTSSCLGKVKKYLFSEAVARY